MALLCLLKDWVDRDTDESVKAHIVDSLRVVTIARL
jgi:hypothetical protein